MKKTLAGIIMILIILASLSAYVSGTDPRSFRFVIKREIKDPFKVMFVDRNSSASMLNQIQDPSIALSTSPELAYYMVFAVKQPYSLYSVDVHVSAFADTAIATKILPASLYVSNEGVSQRTVASDIPAEGCDFDLTGFYGPAAEGDGAEYYFFGFFYSFPDMAKYIPGTYVSNVTVEVSGE
ncbi:MAG: hypothetical protein ACI4NM_08600 [Bullifex sp.]